MSGVGLVAVQIQILGYVNLFTQNVLQCCTLTLSLSLKKLE